MPEKLWKGDEERPQWTETNRRTIEDGRKTITITCNTADINGQTRESITIDVDGRFVHFPRRDAKEIAKMILEVAGE